MSFQIFHFQPTCKEKLSENVRKDNPLRKEEDSAMTQSISSFPEDEEGASLLPSFSGSISIEAAFVTPIFFSGSLLPVLSAGSHVCSVLCAKRPA